MPIVIGTIESTVVVDDSIGSKPPKQTTEGCKDTRRQTAHPATHHDLEDVTSIRFQARSAATDWR